MFALLPATMAAGQFIDNPRNNAAGEAPPPAQPERRTRSWAARTVRAAERDVLVIDADSDGKITARELRRAAMQLKKLDVDKDGNITLAEVSPRGGPVGPAGQRAPAEAPRR